MPREHYAPQAPHSMSDFAPYRLNTMPPEHHARAVGIHLAYDLQAQHGEPDLPTGAEVHSYGLTVTRKGLQGLIVLQWCTTGQPGLLPMQCRGAAGPWWGPRVVYWTWLSHHSNMSPLHHPTVPSCDALPFGSRDVPSTHHRIAENQGAPGHQQLLPAAPTHRKPIRPHPIQAQLVPSHGPTFAMCGHCDGAVCKLVDGTQT